MSLSETQEIMQICQEIIRLLDGIEVKTVKLNQELPKTKESIASMKDLERIMIRYLAIAKRAGMPDDIQGQIQLISQLIVTVRMLHMSYVMLTSTTPIGVIMGVAGIVLSGMTLYDSMEGY